MRNFFTYLIAAIIGGTAYCTLEIVWRGRTHYSMFFAGAIVAASFFYISESFNLSFWAKCAVGALIITAVELIFGIVFNLILKEHVWDYSNMPLNFLGQICVPFSALWFVLSGIVFKIIDRIAPAIAR